MANASMMGSEKTEKVTGRLSLDSNFRRSLRLHLLLPWRSASSPRPSLRVAAAVDSCDDDWMRLAADASACRLASAPDLRSLPLVAAERKNVASENLDVVKRLLGRIASYNSTHVPNTAWPRFDNASCPQPQPMTKQTVWMPWRKDGAPEGV